ncbi:MAG TPA: caspase family protein [Thermoanaerobaculia bacterium]|nr:caspase family protein [Thermoanaerobaculia bacterium]
MSRKLALLIGNSMYGPGLPPLEKPDADIAALAKVLADPAIGGFDEVKPLLDATSATARREVARFFFGRSPDDLLLLYFSGHGLRNDRGGLYLAVQDTEAELLSGTAVPATFISEEMDNCRSRRQILILDCCYSGAFERGAKGPAANPAAAFKGNGLGRFVLTASDSTQLAWEDVAATSTGGLSVFTHHLVRGLESGEADLDGDGLISIDELYDYVYARVVEENPRQIPGKSISKQQGEIFLARNPAGPKLRPLPAELVQALDHPLATVREGAVRELERFLRGSDTGMAKAARKAVEQACDDDSRRVAKAAAEILASVVPAKAEPVSPPKPAPESQQAAAAAPTSKEVRQPQATPIFSARKSSTTYQISSDATAHTVTEQTPSDDSHREALAAAEVLTEVAGERPEPAPLLMSVPKPQSVPTPKTNEGRPTSPERTPSAPSMKLLRTYRKNVFSKRVWIALGVLVLLAATALLISQNKKRSGNETAETPAVSPESSPTTSPTVSPESSPAFSVETPTQPDPSQALLTEAKSWPLVIAENFDSGASGSFKPTDLNGETSLGTSTGSISTGMLRLSLTPKTKEGSFVPFPASRSITAADFYLRVDLAKTNGVERVGAGLIFRGSHDVVRHYIFMIEQNRYRCSVYTSRWQHLLPWTPSAAIHPEQTNSLAVVAIGPDLTLFINDQKVDQVFDATLKSGRVGLGLESRGVEPATFAFDNFELRRRPEPYAKRRSR